MIFGFGKKLDLTLLRKQMDAALKSTIVPQLRQAGFKGSYPHFRRETSAGTDLLVFQFSQYGGGFVVEISYAPEGYVHSRPLPKNRHLQVWDMSAYQRVRVSPKGTVGGFWFRFENGQIDKCIRQAEQALPMADIWWKSRSEEISGQESFISPNASRM